MKLPTSPSGFVPVIPHADRAELEENPWCNRAFQTDGDSWDEFGYLATARDTISAELEAQKINQMFYVDNECFWQITESKNDPDTLFGVFMDSSTLSPTRPIRMAAPCCWWTTLGTRPRWTRS